MLVFGIEFIFRFLFCVGLLHAKWWRKRVSKQAGGHRNRICKGACRRNSRHTRRKDDGKQNSFMTLAVWYWSVAFDSNVFHVVSGPVDRHTGSHE